MSRGSWFSELFGFLEMEGDPKKWEQTKEKLKTRPKMHSDYQEIGNPELNLWYCVGDFDTPQLRDLRDSLKGRSATSNGKLTIDFEFGDISSHMADERFNHATFQVASQLNCLEFVDPSVRPSDGITRYIADKTQGPACCIATGPATAYRNYFMNSDEIQINNLKDMLAAIESKMKTGTNGDFLLKIEGGYTIADRIDRLKLIKGLLEGEGQNSEFHEDIMGEIRIGWHRHVEVTSSNWGQKRVADKQKQFVNLALCSACAIAYNDGEVEDWDPFAQLVLRAAYEATLAAALKNWKDDNPDQKGANVVFLTSVGGGVFGNPHEWIMEAIRLACRKYQDSGLRVIINRFDSHIPLDMQMLQEEFGSYNDPR